MDIDDLQNTVVSGQPTVEELEYTVTSKSANIAEASAVAGSDPPDLDLERQIKSLDTLDSAITIDAVANHQSTPVSVQSDSNPQQVGPVQLSLDVMARPAVFIPEPATEPAFQSSNDFAVVDSAVIQNQGEPKSAAPVAFKMMLDLPVETCSRYSTCSDLPMDANKDKDLQNDCEFQPKNVTYCTPSLDLPFASLSFNCSSLPPLPLLAFLFFSVYTSSFLFNTPCVGIHNICVCVSDQIHCFSPAKSHSASSARRVAFERAARQPARACTAMALACCSRPPPREHRRLSGPLRRQQRHCRGLRRCCLRNRRKGPRRRRGWRRFGWQPPSRPPPPRPRRLHILDEHLRGHGGEGAGSASVCVV